MGNPFVRPFVKNPKILGHRRLHGVKCSLQYTNRWSALHYKLQWLRTHSPSMLMETDSSGAVAGN